METVTATLSDWKSLAHTLGRSFSSRAARHDADGSFVFENYTELRAHQLFSATIPKELGGGGWSHGDMCNFIRVLAHYCGSTALAFSMHQHLVAAAIWRFLHKGEAVPMLQKVVKEQLVLVSTGARDWLDSNGEMTRVEGGYRLSGRKHFASQSIAGDMAVTSAPYQHPEQGWQVMHFAVPMKAEGVSVLDDWDVMSMRGTGSQTIVFEDVFVPDASIVLQRPRTGFHPVWDVVLTVAMPLIMSVYVGLAERSVEIAIAIGKTYARNQKHFPYIVGKMNNALVAAQTQWRAMVTLANNIRFTPAETSTLEMISLKTNVARASIETVGQAMEGIGGQSIYRKNELERIFRDVQAANFHPLPEWDQFHFTGERLLAKSVDS